MYVDATGIVEEATEVPINPAGLPDMRDVLGPVGRARDVELGRFIPAALVMTPGRLDG